MYQAQLKRILDIAIAILTLTIAAPLLLAVALVVRVTMGSPIWFLQTRAGKEGKPFTIVKFRTMRVGGCTNDAARLTGVGRLLRSLSLDELPELLNVLRGDMSLVGPRPLLMDYLPRYTVTQARRNSVRPGITGLAQISGRNALEWTKRFDLDVLYVDSISLLLDLKILAITVLRVLQRDGIHSDNHPTSPEFMGPESLG
jgi:sugar transferase EpsL